MNSVDNTKRNPELMKAILKTYSRNISTVSKLSTITDDIKNSFITTPETVSTYIEVLESLYVIENINAWCPSVRSKSAIRSGRKRCFVDPSIAVAWLGVSPDYFNTDLKTFGFIFETLCFRALRVYSQSQRGEFSYYRDRYGLEQMEYYILVMEDMR